MSVTEVDTIRVDCCGCLTLNIKLISFIYVLIIFVFYGFSLISICLKLMTIHIIEV